MEDFRSARVALGIALAVIVCLGVETHLIHAQKPDDKSEINHGRYLVEEVAKCAECHSPRNANGELDPETWLQGAPIWIQPVRPIRDWADDAPVLAALPGLTEEEAERVLEKGTGPEGETLRPPMHIYHMNHADAKAIIAYLNSLPRRIH